MKQTYVYLSMLFAVLVLLSGCSGMQQSDSDFLLDQSVIRSLEAAESSEEADERVDMWEVIALGLRSAATNDNSTEVKNLVTSVVMAATEGKDLTLADKRALDYLAQRVVPTDVEASVPLTDAQKATILRASRTITDAVTFWKENR